MGDRIGYFADLFEALLKLINNGGTRPVAILNFADHQYWGSHKLSYVESLGSGSIGLAHLLLRICDIAGYFFNVE